MNQLRTNCFASLILAWNEQLHRILNYLTNSQEARSLLAFTSFSYSPVPSLLDWPRQQRAMAGTVKHGQGAETKPVVVRKLGIK